MPDQQAEHPDQPCGLVLAAGAGTRFGGPKALVRAADGASWIARAVRMLRAGGCGEVLVALGAGAVPAAELVPPDAEIVLVPDWDRGLARSLIAGLAAAAARGAGSVVITPVDTPDAPPSAVRRVIAGAGGGAGRGPTRALVQATYGGAPGHPVLIGSDHFAALAQTLSGDRGARAYLLAHGAVEIECADLWSGADVDEAPRPG